MAGPERAMDPRGCSRALGWVAIVVIASGAGSFWLAGHTIILAALWMLGGVGLGILALLLHLTAVRERNARALRSDPP